MVALPVTPVMSALLILIGLSVCLGDNIASGSAIGSGSKEHSYSNFVPKIFVIGFPKCGTTVTAHYLSGHPNLLLPTKYDRWQPGYYNKETHYFERKDSVRLGFTEYSRFYPKLRKQHIQGNVSVKDALIGVDATPSIQGIIPMERLRKCYSNANLTSSMRFVINMREPFDGVRSFNVFVRKTCGKVCLVQNKHLLNITSGYGNNALEVDLLSELNSPAVQTCPPSAEWWKQRNELSIDEFIWNFQTSCPPVLRNYLYVVFMQLYSMAFGKRVGLICPVFQDDLKLPRMDDTFVDLQRCLELPQVIEQISKHVKKPPSNYYQKYDNTSEVSEEVKAATRKFYRPWLCSLDEFLTDLNGVSPVLGAPGSQRTLAEWMPTKSECEAS
jgi:hypothetical protein